MLSHPSTNPFKSHEYFRISTASMLDEAEPHNLKQPSLIRSPPGRNGTTVFASDVTRIFLGSFFKYPDKGIPALQRILLLSLGIDWFIRRFFASFITLLLFRK